MDDTLEFTEVKLNENEMVEIKCDHHPKEEGELEMIYEMDLQKKSRYFGKWSNYRVKIAQDTNSIYIENSKDFENTVGISKLPLNKCTVSFKTRSEDRNNTIIQIMVLNYQQENKSLQREFKLPHIHNNIEYKKESNKFKLFAATLMHYGTQFDKLKSLLQKWDNAKNDINLNALSKPEIIEIFRIKYDYDLYLNRYCIDKYVDMIENMQSGLIKPLKSLLDLKKFRTQEPQLWELRCKKALEIEYEWKLLLQQIRVQMESISKVSQLSERLKSKPYDKIQQYRSIQNNLTKLIRDMKQFTEQYIRTELVEWERLSNKYKDLLGELKSSDHWKWIIGGAVCVAVCAVIVVLIFCPPAAGVAARTAGGATTDTAMVAAVAGSGAAATGTAVTEATFGIGSILGVVGAGVVGATGIAAVGYGLYKVPEYYWIHKDVAKVKKLWKQFENEHLEIHKNVQNIANHGIIQDGPGWDHDHHLIAASYYVQQNIKYIEQMCRKCVARIEKCSQ